MKSPYIENAVISIPNWNEVIDLLPILPQMFGPQSRNKCMLQSMWYCQNLVTLSALTAVDHFEKKSWLAGSTAARQSDSKFKFSSCNRLLVAVASSGLNGANLGIIHFPYTKIVDYLPIYMTLQWRHDDHGGVSNHQPHGCLLNRLFRRRSKKTSKLRVTGLCVGKSRTKGQLRGKCFHLMTSSWKIIFITAVTIGRYMRQG